MADIQRAIESVLRQEDSRLTGAIVNLGDGAGWTRLGITSKNHPELLPSGFFDSHEVSRDQALVIAEKVYAQAYAVPLRVAQITDQTLANALLSFGINSGIHTAALTLQQAASLYGMHIACDGVIGPSTLSAIQMINPTQLLSSFCARADAYYQMLVDLHPEDQKFLRGWQARVDGWRVA